MKRIWEILQRRGQPMRVIAHDAREALSKAHPMAGEVIELTLYDDRDCDRFDPLYLEKVLNFEPLEFTISKKDTQS